MIKVDNAGLMTGQYWMSIKGTWLKDQSTGHSKPFTATVADVQAEVWSMKSQAVPALDMIHTYRLHWLKKLGAHHEHPAA